MPFALPPPHKPIAQMTEQELREYADLLGLPVHGSVVALPPATQDEPNALLIIAKGVALGLLMASVGGLIPIEIPLGVWLGVSALTLWRMRR